MIRPQNGGNDGQTELATNMGMAKRQDRVEAGGRAMSEYHYYEFQAIDRALTEHEMGELRSWSRRARITATSFVNEYSWGNFKGDEDVDGEVLRRVPLPRQLGDAHRQAAAPGAAADAATARQYCRQERTRASEKRKNHPDIPVPEGGRGLGRGRGELSSLVSVRSELARGDQRALYLGWLLCAQNGELDDDELEPSGPPALGS